MAGRGVDILLGGSMVSDEEAHKEAGDDYEYRRGGKPIVGLTPVGERGSAEHQEEADEVRALGGLFILGSERHEARRIDNQLRGRAGRQGDPGASRFYVSLEDELWRLFGDKANSPLLQGWAEDQAIDAKMLSAMIARAQKKVEMLYFDQRKSTLDYDDVMNVQRANIYGERRRIMEGADLRETIVGYLRDAVEGDISQYAPDGVSPEEWDLEGLYNSLSQTFPLRAVRHAGRPEGQETPRTDGVPDDHRRQVLRGQRAAFRGDAGRRRRAVRRCATWSVALPCSPWTGTGWSICPAWTICAKASAGAATRALTRWCCTKRKPTTCSSRCRLPFRKRSSASCPSSRSAWSRNFRRIRWPICLRLLEQGADEDGMGHAGPLEAVSGPGAQNGINRAERRRVTKGKSRARH